MHFYFESTVKVFILFILQDFTTEMHHRQTSVNQTVHIYSFTLSRMHRPISTGSALQRFKVVPKDTSLIGTAVASCLKC